MVLKGFEMGVKGFGRVWKGVWKGFGRGVKGFGRGLEGGLEEV